MRHRCDFVCGFRAESDQRPCRRFDAQPARDIRIRLVKDERSFAVIFRCADEDDDGDAPKSRIIVNERRIAVLVRHEEITRPIAQELRRLGDEWPGGKTLLHEAGERSKVIDDQRASFLGNDELPGAPHSGIDRGGSGLAIHGRRLAVSGSDGLPDLAQHLRRQKIVDPIEVSHAS